MTACLLGSCGCPPLVASASFSSALPKRALLLSDNVVGRLRKTAQGIPISRRLLEAHIAETERTIANSEEEIRAISARQPDTADQAAAERQTRRAAVLVTL